MAAHDGSDDLSRRTFMRAATGSAAAAGAASAAASAQEGGNESSGGNESAGGNESGGGGGGGETWEVTVGPGGDLVFDPEERVVAPGDTVHWIWDSDNHNVAPTSVPEGAEWEGHPEIANTGTEYEHTFETTGTFEYVCEPHAGSGMEGSVVVQEGGPQESGGGHSGPVVPNNALSLAVGTIGAMVSTLALAYFFIKYGGYEEEQ